MFLKGPLGAFEFLQEYASFVDPKPAIEIPAKTISAIVVYFFKFVLLAGPPNAPVLDTILFSLARRPPRIPTMGSNGPYRRPR